MVINAAAVAPAARGAREEKFPTAPLAARLVHASLDCSFVNGIPATKTVFLLLFSFEYLKSAKQNEAGIKEKLKCVCC